MIEPSDFLGPIGPSDTTRELTVLDGVVTRHELKTDRDQYMTAPVSEGREISLVSLSLSRANSDR